MSKLRNSKVHRVVLRWPLGITHSVFVRAKNRKEAEANALRKYPDAIGIDRSPFPQN